MRAPHLAVTTALATVLSLGTAYAQSGQADGTAGQTGANATQQSAQAGQGQSGNMRIKNEVASYKGSELYVSPAGTRQIQQALNKQGFDVGNVSGKWNDGTGRAAANFMQAQGLEPTTSLTVSLVRALGLTNILQGQGAGSSQQQQSNQRLAQEKALKGTPLHVSPAGVRVIKQAINQQGYDVGNINGQWDDQTTQAVKTYQQVHGYEPVGVLDVSLIKALGVGGQVFAGGQGGQGGANGQQAAAGGQGGTGSQTNQRIAQEAAASGGGNQSGSQQTASSGNSGNGNGASQAAAGNVSPGTPLYISTAGVRDLTQALNKVGYDAGPVDGQWSDGLSTAVANYEQAKGLEPTGTLTTAFIANIGLNQWLPLQGGGQGGNQVSQNGATAGNSANGASNQRITNETATGSISGGTGAQAGIAGGQGGTSGANGGANAQGANQ